MIDTTRTTTLLLEGLHDSDDAAAWAEFDARYRPILLAFARKLGLDDSDAADVAQDTIARFIDEYRAGRYDRDRGRLRSWLLTIARTRIAMIYRKADTRREARGDSAFITLEDDAALTQVWDEQQRTFVLQQALVELRRTTKAADRTVEAFELLVFQQMPVDAVAARLNMSRHDVYLAKSRMAQRLRSIVEQLEFAYTEA